MKKFFLLSIFAIFGFSLILTSKELPKKSKSISTEAKTEMISADTQPECDLNDLMKKVKYPEEARINSIEGKVIVKALIGTDGKVLKTKVVKSDNKKFNESAVNAVLETSFKPATANNKNVSAWVVIPIQFRLK